LWISRKALIGKATAKGNRPLQATWLLSVVVLPSSKGTAAPANAAVVSLGVVGMDVSFGGNGRVGMLRVTSDDAATALRAFHLGGHFNARRQGFAPPKDLGQSQPRQIERRKSPQLAAVAGLPVAEQSQKAGLLPPTPELFHPLAEQLLIPVSDNGTEPVAAGAFQCRQRPALALLEGRFFSTRVYNSSASIVMSLPSGTGGDQAGAWRAKRASQRATVL
jgi:hypothetical protein